MIIQLGDVISFRTSWDNKFEPPNYGVLATVDDNFTINIIDALEGNRWFAANRIPVNGGAKFDLYDHLILEKAFDIQILNVLKRDIAFSLIKQAFKNMTDKQVYASPKKFPKKPANKEELNNYVLDTIRGTKGKIFTVRFEKADGTMRTMNCRLGVGKYVKGTGKPHTDPKTVTVFDLQINDYRSFNTDRVQWIKTGGKMFANPNFKNRW
jgi:hypothetical protein